MKLTPKELQSRALARWLEMRSGRLIRRLSGWMPTPKALIEEGQCEAQVSEKGTLHELECRRLRGREKHPRRLAYLRRLATRDMLADLQLQRMVAVARARQRAWFALPLEERERQLAILKIGNGGRWTPALPSSDT